MPLFAMDNVSKRFPLTGRSSALGLRDVSLEVEPGEVVAVFGERGSGRTTLLRVAAGVEAPDAGTVRFEGRDVAHDRDALLGRDIAFAHDRFNVAPSANVIEQVALAGHVRGQRLPVARYRAMEMLKRVGAYDAREHLPHQLEPGERIRVVLARALMSEPRLLLLDEPLAGVDLLERDSILMLVRSLANDGLAVLMTIAVSTEFAGATRALALSDGELHGVVKAPQATVIALRAAREA